MKKIILPILLTLLFAGAVYATNSRTVIVDTDNKILLGNTGSEKVAITPEGGVAIKLTNKTGGATVQGYLVHPSGTTANAFDLVGVDEPDILGVVYEAGVADGSECWVVIHGIADVYFGTSTTLEDFARSSVTADDDGGAGIAISESAPTSPFSTDKHFQEIGHVLEARVGAGLAKTVLHFN